MSQGMVDGAVRMVVVVLCLGGAILLSQAIVSHSARQRATRTLRFLAERRLRGEIDRMSSLASDHPEGVTRYLTRVLARLQVTLEPRECAAMVSALYFTSWMSATLAAWTLGLTPARALITGGIIATAVFGGLLAFIDHRSTRIGRTLGATLTELVELTSILVNSGRSVNSALRRVAQDDAHPWSPHLRNVLSAADRGGIVGEELVKLANVVDVPNFERFAELVRLHVNTPELGQLLHAELSTLRRNRHLKLVETLEIRSQLVWIPVSIAILIPGTILLAIPLINSLKFFSAG